ncbi:MAG: hypothetical protein SFY32_14085 [Bacteroidota bacterium]|nr:hypothetical protein [Bacteroidota bacterium]
MKFSQKQTLNILLFISIVTVLINDIIFNETTEIVLFGDELGAVLSNLSLAYIASYIFYYVVVVIKEKKDKRNIYTTVYEWTSHLVGRAYGVYYEIITASGANHLDYDKKTITKEQYLELCKIANPNEIAKNVFLGSPGNPQTATHGTLIYNNSISYVKVYTEKIFNYMPFLDTEHVRLINQLLNSTFFMVATSFTFPTRNTDFSAYAENMYEYLEYVRELDLYNETQNKKLLKNKKQSPINKLRDIFGQKPQKGKM